MQQELTVLRHQVPIRGVHIREVRLQAAAAEVTAAAGLHHQEVTHPAVPEVPVPPGLLPLRLLHHQAEEDR